MVLGQETTFGTEVRIILAGAALAALVAAVRAVSRVSGKLFRYLVAIVELILLGWLRRVGTRAGLDETELNEIEEKLADDGT